MAWSRLVSTLEDRISEQATQIANLQAENKHWNKLLDESEGYLKQFWALEGKGYDEESEAVLFGIGKMKVQREEDYGHGEKEEEEEEEGGEEEGNGAAAPAPVPVKAMDESAYPSEYASAVDLQSMRQSMATNKGDKGNGHIEASASSISSDTSTASTASTATPAKHLSPTNTTTHPSAANPPASTVPQEPGTRQHIKWQSSPPTPDRRSHSRPGHPAFGPPIPSPIVTPLPSLVLSSPSRSPSRSASVDSPTPSPSLPSLSASLFPHPVPLTNHPRTNPYTRPLPDSLSPFPHKSTGFYTPPDPSRPFITPPTRHTGTVPLSQQRWPLTQRNTFGLAFVYFGPRGEVMRIEVRKEDLVGVLERALREGGWSERRRGEVVRGWVGWGMLGVC